MENYAIEVKDVSKGFKTFELRRSGSFFHRLWRKRSWKQALSNVSFRVKEGEIVALLGRNGSGKSTLVKILSGILHPDSGSVRVLGFEPWKDRIKLAARLGVVLGAHSQLFWNISARDSFEFMKGVYSINEREYSQRLKYYLKVLSLGEVFNRQVRSLSLGEQMKCNFVASILHKPKIVFLDEPTIGVDLPSKIALRNAVLDLRAREGTTFILTTHIVEDITMAERVILLNNGSIVFDGSRKQLESMFGDKKHVELRLEEGSAVDFRRYGKLIEKSGDVVKIEVNKSTLKNQRFLRMLNDKSVLDYRVAEPGLNFVLTKFYAKMDRKR
ncbi:MAG: ATP-binding cassette domain-containing protein [Candidatus Micrarchaeota archaeon]|nr:ATP-binding cassette domain-containing protein [Candidatus Micrarchaeota archaeon]